MNPTTIDRLDVGLVELKFAGGSSAERTFSGYGAVFGNVDSYGDVIAKGAFKRTLGEYRKAGRLPPMLLQHGGGPFSGGAEDMTPIGIWTAMSEDASGLRVEGKLADTTRGEDVYKLLKMMPRPAISGLSIGFVAKEFSLGTKAGEPRRTLQAVELIEVSLVTTPANARAQVTAVKSAAELTPRAIERMLCDGGVPQRLAKKIVSGGWRAATTRDGGDDVGAEAVHALAQALKNHTEAFRRSILRNPR